MDINWRAVLTGFVVAVVLGFVISWIYPPSGQSVYFLAFPGIVGGFVAGYMVSGTNEGAVHGGLATIVGGLVLLAGLFVFGLLFVGIVPEIGLGTLALLALLVQAVPGAIAGALGGWVKSRGEPSPVAPAAR